MTTQPGEQVTDPQATDPQVTDSQATDSQVTDSQGSESSVESQPTEPPPSYVKLAMRNMVRKRGKSLYHFTLTTVGLLAVLVGLAYLTR